MSVLVVNFIDGLQLSEVLNILDEQDVQGTRVSSVTNKYAVEVPVGKEEHFSKIFRENPCVKTVNFTPPPKAPPKGRR